MDYPLKDTPEFNATMRKLERDDPGNADVFNPLFQTLLDNDNNIKHGFETVIAITSEEIDALDNASSGGEPGGGTIIGDEISTDDIDSIVE